MSNAYVTAIDWPAFARDVGQAIERDYASLRDCVRSHEGLNTGLLSRAHNGTRVNAESFLYICRCLNLDVWEYLLLTPKVAAKQTVTADVPRVTSLHVSPAVAGSAPKGATLDRGQGQPGGRPLKRSLTMAELAAKHRGGADGRL